MFPYKSFFERHPNIGLYLLISSIGGAIFIPTYFKWLEDKEQEYNQNLQNCDIAELFDLFIQEHKILPVGSKFYTWMFSCIGMEDNIVQYACHRRDETFLYQIGNQNNLQMRPKDGEDRIVIVFGMERQIHYYSVSFCVDPRNREFKKGYFTSLIKKIFSMNEEQAAIAWERAYAYAVQKGNESRELLYMREDWIECGTEPRLTPVRYFRRNTSAPTASVTVAATSHGASLSSSHTVVVI